MRGALREWFSKGAATAWLPAPTGEVAVREGPALGAHEVCHSARARLEPRLVALVALVDPLTPELLPAAGSLTITFPAAVKPRIASRWPELAGMGVPVSRPLFQDMLAMTGTPLAIHRSTCSSEEKRLTEALSP